MDKSHHWRAFAPQFIAKDEVPLAELAAFFARLFQHLCEIIQNALPPVQEEYRADPPSQIALKFGELVHKSETYPGKIL